MTAWSEIIAFFIFLLKISGKICENMMHNLQLGLLDWSFLFFRQLKTKLTNTTRNVCAGSRNERMKQKKMGHKTNNEQKARLVIPQQRSTIHFNVEWSVACMLVETNKRWMVNAHLKTMASNKGIVILHVCWSNGISAFWFSCQTN